MMAIVLTDAQLGYLTYMFEKFCDGGLPTTELGIAASTWGAIEAATPFELPQDTKVINGPVNLVLNGDMSMPLPVEQS